MRSAELVGVAQPIACCGEIGGIGRWGLIGERRMGALMIVIGDPVRNLFPSVIEPEKQRIVQQLVAHTTVEALAKAVLRWLSRCDEMPDDLVLLRPGKHGV